MRLSDLLKTPRTLSSSGLLNRLLAARAGTALEALEPRKMLAGSPLPSIGDLENANNSVVRFETNFGDIDIELFNSVAPITATNFLNYVNSGRFDSTFFHRLAFSGGDPFVLQGGGFSYSNTGGLSEVSTDAPIVRETTNRSNLTRTIAMARTDVINSATSQFFFNLNDNTFLDPTAPNNGFAVFGRVIQGWENILTIQALTARNLSTDPAFAGTNAGAFTEVPTTIDYSSQAGVRENALVTLINAEVIKPQDFNQFFTKQAIVPDGFSSSSSSEVLYLTNTNSTNVAVQIIIRYETGARESIYTSVQLGANQRIQIALPGTDTSTAPNAIRLNTPYSLVIQTATASENASVAASFVRTDFNADTSEAAFNTDGYSNADLQTWDFARIERNALSREFIAWTNLSDQPANITLTFTTSSGTQEQRFVTTPAYRRGGVDVSALGLPEGVLSARVTSSQPIVAMLSDFDLPASGVDPAAANTPGVAVMGTPAGGSSRGAYAAVETRTGVDTTLSFFNPNSTAAVVTLNYWLTGREDGTDPFTRTVIIPSNSRLDETVEASLISGATPNDSFSITYTSGSTPITVQYTSVNPTGRNQAGVGSDAVAATFVSSVPNTISFTNGQFDDIRSDLSTQREIISIFNPISSFEGTFEYTVAYIFNDSASTRIVAATGTLIPNGRVEINTGTNTAVQAAIASGNADFNTYTIVVTALATNPNQPGGISGTPIAGIVQLVRFDTLNGRAYASNGFFSNRGLFLNDDLFQVSIGT